MEELTKETKMEQKNIKNNLEDLILKDISRKDLIEIISNKKAVLENASKELKEHFVGIDDQIDYIIDNISTWYLLPNVLMSRPVTICLWGPTGVGKTDLVRRLVKLLGFKDKYCEIEMGTQTAGWNKSVGAVLRGHSNIESGKPSVLLLDEIQRFRTVDEDGNDIHDYDMKDIWTLLSDGKLPFKAEIDALMSMLWEYNKPELINKHKVSVSSIPVESKMTGHIKKYKRGKIVKSKSGRIPVYTKISKRMSSESEEEIDMAQESKYNYFSLNYFKELLRLDVPLEEIATWTDEKKRQVIVERMMDKSIYEEDDYTKMLIFISGNLDEAYGFTRNTKEVDIDADILYNLSKRISILDIKDALGSRFRPEQISRMGNTHVIYPSLNRKSFEKIIERRVNQIIFDVKQKANLNVSIDKSIIKLIYDNGVFPTQGTRPVFSTISEIIEASLPDFMLNALTSNYDSICLKYEDRKIIALIGNISLEKDYLGTLDKLKDEKRKSFDVRALSAVHESAHALVHAVLFKMAPNQIVSTPISSDMEGFVYSQNIGLSKDMLKKRICGLLAGKEAEKLVFGNENQTSGCSSDLRHATSLAADMVRTYAMSTYSSAIDHAHRDGSINNEIDPTNNIIDSIIREETTNTIKILNDNKKLLIDIVNALTDAEKITPEEFKEICKKHDLEIGIAKSSEEVIYWNYAAKLEEFKKDQKSS